MSIDHSSECCQTFYTDDFFFFMTDKSVSVTDEKLICLGQVSCLDWRNESKFLHLILVFFKSMLYSPSNIGKNIQRNHDIHAHLEFM